MRNSWIYTFRVEKNAVNKTIKEILIEQLVPKKIRGLIRQNKRILLNGANVPVSTTVTKNDEIEFQLNESDFSKVQFYKPNPSLILKVVFEDEDFLVVDKSASVKMHSHSPNETDTILNFAQNYLDGKKSRKHQALAMMTHRIDRATSGLVLIAKNPLAVSIANQMFKNKTIKRTYIAKVSGVLENQLIKDSIGIDEIDPFKRKVSKFGQKAVTAVEKISSNKETSLVKVTLETGRTHQIRVHLSNIGNPIIGDVYYGGVEADRLMLHSKELFLPEILKSKPKIRKINSTFGF